jgi:hypothetical protein
MLCVRIARRLWLKVALDFMSVDSEEQEAGSEKTSPLDIVGKSPKPHPKQSFGE